MTTTNAHTENYPFMVTLLQRVMPTLRSLGDAGVVVKAIKLLPTDNEPQACFLVETSAIVFDLIPNQNTDKHFCGSFNGCQVMWEK